MKTKPTHENARTPDIMRGVTPAAIQPYDIIGDIHGYADELDMLLAKLGYQKNKATHFHPEGRKVVFLGDYIDRGSKIRAVLETVRAMVDTANALAILGNHEVNALWFHTHGPKGKPLRAHTANRIKQHQATLDQLGAEFRDWMPWLAKLPLTLDLGGFRAVHAAWHEAAVAELRDAGPLVGDTLVRYGTALNAREAIFPDDPLIDAHPLEKLPDTQFDPDAPITFFGHYAVKEPIPKPVATRLACLDYGIGKGGFLAAYQWDGETELDPEKFVSVKQNPVHRATPEK